MGCLDFVVRFIHSLWIKSYWFVMVSVVEGVHGVGEPKSHQRCKHRDSLRSGEDTEPQ